MECNFADVIFKQIRQKKASTYNGNLRSLLTDLLQSHVVPFKSDQFDNETIQKILDSALIQEKTIKVAEEIL